jgi:hypothetical protein
MGIQLLGGGAGQSLAYLGAGIGQGVANIGGGVGNLASGASPSQILSILLGQSYGGNPYYQTPIQGTVPAVAPVVPAVVPVAPVIPAVAPYVVPPVVTPVVTPVVPPTVNYSANVVQSLGGGYSPVINGVVLPMCVPAPVATQAFNQVTYNGLLKTATSAQLLTYLKSTGYA